MLQNGIPIEDIKNHILEHLRRPSDGGWEDEPFEILRSKADEQKQDRPQSGEILKEVEEYLNQNRKEGQSDYILNEYSAKMAYSMRREGFSLLEIKAAIDELNKNELDNLNLEEEVSGGGYSGENYSAGDYFSASTTGTTDPLFEQTNPKSIFSKIIQEIRSKHPDFAHIPFEDQVEEFSLILLERGDSAHSVKQQILNYLEDHIQENMEQPQAYTTPEKKPFALDVEGQGFDQGYLFDESPTSEEISIKDLHQEHYPTSNETSKSEIRIREITMDEMPGTWDETEGLMDDPRYIQETKNPETGEWENPVYLGTTNPNIDSWENLDRVKNVDTGELYTDEEWTEILRNKNKK